MSSIELQKIAEISLEKSVGLIVSRANKGPWSFEEQLELIRIINNFASKKFIKRSIVLDYKNKDSIMYKKNLSDKDKKAVEKGFKKKTATVHLYREFEIGDIVDLFIDNSVEIIKDNIAWNEISTSLMSKIYIV